VVAYGFYLLLEKPVLERRKASVKEVFPAAAAATDAAA